MVDGFILQDIKKMLLIDATDTSLDATDTSLDAILIPYINAAFVNLHQMGIGESVYHISSSVDKWTSFSTTTVESIKTYIYLKVRLFFDPPSNNHLLEAINKQIVELEWRITNNTFMEGGD